MVDNCIICPATYLALNRQERLGGISEEWWIAIRLPVPAADYVFSGRIKPVIIPQTALPRRQYVAGDSSEDGFVRDRKLAEASAPGIY